MGCTPEEVWIMGLTCYSPYKCLHRSQADVFWDHAASKHAMPVRRKKVVEAAAQRAQATAEWLETHEFLPQSELSSWVDVVRLVPALLLAC